MRLLNIDVITIHARARAHEITAAPIVTIAKAPGRIASFSAAKYGAADHIEDHDDKAVTAFQLEDGDGAATPCSRDIACIYYLAKGEKIKLSAFVHSVIAAALRKSWGCNCFD